MKRKGLWAVVALLALVAFGLALGCQRARTDAQIAGDVQTKLNGDPAIQTRQYTVQANNGVVTLSGMVGNEAERSVAAGDAAQVEGVRTVVNNLEVAPPVVAEAPAPEPPKAVAPAVRPLRETARAPRRSTPSKPSGFQLPAPPPTSSPATYSAQNNPGGHELASNAPTGLENPAPMPPPKPVEVTVPEGTSLSIRLIDPIDSEKNQPGDSFRATLDSPIAVNDRVVIPAGADVYGKVTNVKSAAHFAGSSQLSLELTRISVSGKSYEIHTDQFSRQGTGRGKNTAEKMGGGAALGAVIGALAGGGKGAAIGGAIGAGAGGTAQAVTKGQQIRLTSEQLLSFHLEAPVTVTPSSRMDRNAGRQRLDVSQGSRTDYNSSDNQ